MESIRAFSRQHEGKIIGAYSRASVLVPIVDIDGELNILYEVRSENLSTQPGEVSFPGGKLEECETPRAAAVRETCEELGIESKDVEVLCELDRIRTYSNFTMYAFLGVLDYDTVNKAQFNTGEVKELFYVPVDYFVQNKPLVYECDVIPDIGDDFPYDKVNFRDGYSWRKGRTAIPIYEHTEHVIWGLTARITMTLIEEIKAFLAR